MQWRGLHGKKLRLLSITREEFRSSAKSRASKSSKKWSSCLSSAFRLLCLQTDRSFINFLSKWFLKPGYQKLCEIIKVCYTFLLSFGVIHYAPTKLVSGYRTQLFLFLNVCSYPLHSAASWYSCMEIFYSVRWLIPHVNLTVPQGAQIKHYLWVCL